MDKEKAIASFLAHLEGLSRLPLITDAEMKELYGREVAAVLSEMERYDRENQVCSNCEHRCCPAIDCEFYAPQFDCCPIHDFRPVVCRLHFCVKFPIASNPLMREMDDIFFDSLLTAERSSNSRVRFFDTPPLSRAAPELVSIGVPLVEAVRQGTLSPADAERLIHKEVEKYRTPNNKLVVTQTKQT